MGYDNSNRGAMWSSTDKQSDKHPDFKGSLNVGGMEYWLSGWKRKAGANPAAPVVTFSIEAKQGHRGADRKEHGESTPPADYDFDDDLPF